MLYLCYLCRFKPLRDHLRGFLIAAWAGDKIAEFSFPEISFHFPLRPWFFFVSPAYAGKRFSTPSIPQTKGGITPAYAGKSHCSIGGWRQNRDYPRVCGEKPTEDMSATVALGSPPRMRGKVPYDCFLIRVSWDHPRVCGEKQLFPHSAEGGKGSPPAYAGKSFLVNLAAQPRGDHPRVCGEKEALILF